MAAKAEDLVPLFVGRSAEAEERRQVEEAAQTDPQIQDEVVFWREVEAAVQSDGNEPTPDERGWSRLEKTLDQNRVGSRQAELNQSFAKRSKIVELPRDVQEKPRVRPGPTPSSRLESQAPKRPAVKRWSGSWLPWQLPRWAPAALTGSILLAFTVTASWYVFNIEPKLAERPQAAALDERLLEATAALARADEQMAASREEMARLRAEADILKDQLADALNVARESSREIVRLQADRERLAARLSARDQQLAALQQPDQPTNSQSSDGQIASLSKELMNRDAQLDAVAAHLANMAERNGWQAQIAGYHRGYAGSAHEVELGADQREELLAWFEKKLGTSFAVPDLSDTGMSFIGGRLVFIQGEPVAQFAYHDSQDRLLGFCIKRQASLAKAPEQSENGELNLVEWSDKDFQYLLIGYAEHDELAPIAARLAESYHRET